MPYTLTCIMLYTNLCHMIHTMLHSMLYSHRYNMPHNMLHTCIYSILYCLYPDLPCLPAGPPLNIDNASIFTASKRLILEHPAP